MGIQIPLLVIDQRVSHHFWSCPGPQGVTLKGIRCIQDRFGITREIKENSGIVPEEIRNSSECFELFKKLFKYVQYLINEINIKKSDLNN